jgi:hypothetical protein
MTPQGFIQLSLSMRFNRYPKGEAYQITPRKLAAARRAVQREKDRYPLFPELLKHQTAEDRLASIANEQEAWWQQMLDRHANMWRKARQSLNRLPPGPRAAIKRYWKICGCPGDPVYLLTLVHGHRARKVCYWHVVAELRRLRLRFQKSS